MKTTRKFMCHNKHKNVRTFKRSVFITVGTITIVLMHLFLCSACAVETEPFRILEPSSFLTPDNLACDKDYRWYQNNIPFFDCPQSQGGDKIRQTYYYRWRVIKNHARHTAKSGYVFTEFIDGDNWRARDPFVKNSYSAINAGAGFVIDEIRWLRDGRYARDHINHFLGGYGRLMEYTDWLGDALYGHYLVSGDAEFAIEHLPHLVSVYSLRKALEYDDSIGLYHTRPIVDAMENNATSKKHGGGVRTFRPTYASYMYSYARAISDIAGLAGDRTLKMQYDSEAKDLKRALHHALWSPDTDFFMEKLRDGKTFGPARDLLGYAPWAFHVTEDQPNYINAWKQLIDADGFNGPYGLRTTEKRSEYYFNNKGRNTCCWDGPSWPFTTSMALDGMANILNDYGHKGVVSRKVFYEQLVKFTLQHYKDGIPYLAESYNPDLGLWWCDIASRSQDYLHSKYIDLIVTGLAGLRPQRGNTFTVNPLIPEEWTHFCLENVPYRGRMVTIVYDVRQKGLRYQLGGEDVRSGLTVLIDGKVSSHAEKLQPLSVTVVPRVVAFGEGDVNYSFRDYRFIGKQGYPSIQASFKGSGELYQVIDGTVLYYKDLPRNRFTFQGSPNSSDHIIIDLGEDKPISEVKVYFYDDGEAVRCPESYKIEYSTNASPEQFVAAQNVITTPKLPAANAVNVSAFDRVLARKWRITFLHAGKSRTGLCEISLTGLGEGVQLAENGLAIRKVIVPESYRDEFKLNRRGTEATGWVNYGGAWFVGRNKRYQVNKGAEHKAILSLNTGNFGNYREMDYSAEILLKDETGHAGLLFRASNAADGSNAFKGWYAGIGNKNVVLGFSDGVAFTKVKEVPNNFKSNIVYSLTVQCAEEDGYSQIKVYLNNISTPIITYEDRDSHYRCGFIGLRACDTAAEFGKIRVQTPTGSE